MNLKLMMTKIMKRMCTYLPASTMRKIRKFLLFNWNLRGGKKGIVEQHRDFHIWNWNGNKSSVQ
jgi:hypothetical protein